MQLELKDKNMATIERCVGFTLSIIGDHTCNCGRPDCAAKAAQDTVMGEIAELVQAMKAAGYEFTQINVNIIPLGDGADVHTTPGSA